MKLRKKAFLGFGGICVLALTGCGTTSSHITSSPRYSNNYGSAYTFEGDENYMYETATREKPGKPSYGTVSYESYTVVKGDSYWKIAQRHHVSLQELLEANGASKNDILRVGQEIQIPVHKIDPSLKTYVVQRGDSLSAIARRNGCTVNDLREVNHLSSDVIQVGQVLTLPSDCEAPVPSQNSSIELKDSEMLYVVRRGDTLSGIAQAYGMSVRELMDLNHLSSANMIREGQKIKVIKGRPNARGMSSSYSAPATSTPKVVNESPKNESHEIDEDLLDLFDEEDLFDTPNN